MEVHTQDELEDALENNSPFLIAEDFEFEVIDGQNILDLSRNNIGAEGAKAIADALVLTKAPLNHLDLSQNDIGDHGAKAIAKALAKTTAPINKLYLYCNNIGKEYLDKIKELLEITKHNVIQNTCTKSAIF